MKGLLTFKNENVVKPILHDMEVSLSLHNRPKFQEISWALRDAILKFQDPCSIAEMLRKAGMELRERDRLRFYREISFRMMDSLLAIQDHRKEKSMDMVEAANQRPPVTLVIHISFICIV